MPLVKLFQQSNLLAAEDYDGFHDPHVWFDVQLWVLVTKEITKQLIKIAPEHKASFLKNESNYIKQLLRNGPMDKRTNQLNSK